MRWFYDPVAAAALAGFLGLAAYVAATQPDELVAVQVSDYTAHARKQEQCADTASKVVLHLITTNQTRDVPSIDTVLEELCK